MWYDKVKFIDLMVYILREPMRRTLAAGVPAASLLLDGGGAAPEGMGAAANRLSQPTERRTETL